MLRTFSVVPFLLLAGCSAPQEPKPVAQEAPPQGPLKITMFYASPPNPPIGERSMVCYGTENATAVVLEPPTAEVWPTRSRCFEVFPKKKLTFKLTAKRGAEEVAQMVTVAPGPPSPELIEVRVDALEVPAGSPVHVCYKAKNAASVTVTPGEYLQHEPDKGCVRMVVEQTTSFHVRVLDAAGDMVDGEDVSVRVKR